MKKFWTYLVIMGVAVVCAFNYEIFVFPNKFAPSGLNGICTMIQYLSGVSIGYLSLLINIPLALMVYKCISKPLAIRSMVYVVTFSLSLLILDKLDLSALAYSTDTGTSTILGPLVAGIIYGGCSSVLVRASAYSGGTDFVAAMIHKYHPEQSLFWLIFGINSIVAFGSYFVYGYQVEPVILCILYSFASSTVTDRLAKSGRSAVRFEIITDYPKEIKSFYMRLNDDGKTVAATDMLVPGVGELIGGSQREERMDVLLERMKELNLKEEDYWWYLELRTFCPSLAR